MAEEEKKVEAAPAQPKKKRRHKGAIIAWSIIGGVVLTIGGFVIGVSLASKNSAPTSIIQGKKFEVQASSLKVKFIDENNKEADGILRAAIHKYISDNAKSSSDAKKINDGILYYTSDDAASKYQGTYVQVSSTSLFDYNVVKASLMGSGESEWFHKYYQSNQSRDGLGLYMAGDEMDQYKNLRLKVGYDCDLQLKNASKNATSDPSFTLHGQFGTVTYDKVDYYIGFYLDYALVK